MSMAMSVSILFCMRGIVLIYWTGLESLPGGVQINDGM
jgi:hypothetical protein